MKLFTYRRQRVKNFHKKIKGITWFCLWFPFLLSICYYIYLHLHELKIHPLPQGYYIGAILLSSSLLTWFINRLCYVKILFFQKLNSLRILSRYLLENNIYLVKKSNEKKEQ